MYYFGIIKKVNLFYKYQNYLINFSYTKNQTQAQQTYLPPLSALLQKQQHYFTIVSIVYNTVMNLIPSNFQTYFNALQ